jgi:cell division protein FtsQ
MANQRRRARRARRPSRAVRLTVRVLAGVVTAAGLAVALVVAVDWARHTPLLAVRSVEVEGTRRLEEEAVRAAAALAPGVNLLELDVAATEARLARLPGVRRVHVVRHLPDRVVLVVEEREPYALVNAGGLAWVDAEGFLVDRPSRPGAPALPILTGVEVPAAAAGPSDRLRAGLALLHTLQAGPERLVGRVSEIDLGAPHGPVLYLVDGVEVRLGTDPGPERLARLDGVLAELDGRGERVLSIDLRFRDLVVLTPRAPAPGAGPGARRRPGAVRVAAPAAPAPERR